MQVVASAQFLIPLTNQVANEDSKLVSVGLGEKANLMCRFPTPISSCYFSLPGESDYVEVDPDVPANDTSQYEYLGSGFQHGDCGVTLLSVQNFGKAECFLQPLTGPVAIGCIDIMNNDEQSFQFHPFSSCELINFSTNPTTSEHIKASDIVVIRIGEDPTKHQMTDPVSESNAEDEVSIILANILYWTIVAIGILCTIVFAVFLIKRSFKFCHRLPDHSKFNCDFN